MVIVKRPDSCPLAIELAAARIPVLPVEELAARLSGVMLPLLRAHDRCPCGRRSPRASPWTHFLMPSDDPLEDTQTVALYDFEDGVARYLHTNCRVHPRTSD
jgi:hypothetical protein